jgi:hypothetical protein
LCNDIEVAHTAVVNEMAIVEHLRGAFLLFSFIQNTCFPATLPVDNRAHMQHSCDAHMQSANQMCNSLIEKRQVRIDLVAKLFPLRNIRVGKCIEIGEYVVAFIE